MALVLDGDNGIVGVLATNNDGDVIFDTNTLFVDAVENKVGIGTTSPGDKLHVYNTSGNTYAKLESDGNNTRSALLPYAKKSDGSIIKGFIGVVGDANKMEVATTTNDPIHFYTNNNPTNSGIFLNVDGNVGIGTSNPQKILHTYGSGAQQLRVESPDSTSELYLLASGTNTSYLSNSNNLQIWTNGGRAITVDASQRVGIGTDNPGDKLTISGGHLNITSTAYGIKLPGAITSDGQINYRNAGSSVVLNSYPLSNQTIRLKGSTDLLNFESDKTGVGTVLNMNTSGHVGIGGLPTSIYGLEIQRSNAGAGLYLHNKDVPSVNGAGIYNAYQITQTNGQSARLAEITALGVSGWGGELLFTTKPSNGSPNNSTAEAMKIDSSGTVTIPNQPTFQANNSGSQSISQDAKISFTSTAFDVGNNFSTTNDRFTAPVSGKYFFSFTASISNMSSTGAYLAVYFRKNGGGTGHRFRTRAEDVGGEWTGIMGTAIMNLSSGDYIEVNAYNHTGNFTMQGGEYFFSGYLIA